MRAAKKNKKGDKLPPKGAAAKSAETEIDQMDTPPFGEAAKSSEPAKFGRQPPKRKYRKEHQQPRGEEQDESTESRSKKPKSTSGEDQLKMDRSEPTASPRRTRATRTRNQTHRPPPDKLKESVDDIQPSSSAATRKRPRKNATK